MATPASDRESEVFRDATRRREEILSVARTLFLDHGYHPTTTRMIAKAAGVSDALLYRYFPSKRDLFDAVVDEALGHLQPYLTFGAPHLEGLRLRETLEAAAYTTVEIIRRDQEVFRLIVQESRLLEGDDRLAELLTELQRHVAARIAAFVAAGEARRTDPDVFARQFVGGVAMEALYATIFPGAGTSPAADGGDDDRRDDDFDGYLRNVVDDAVAALRP